MSILRKPYKISVWDDIWDGEKFVEKKLGVIGSDEMSFGGRVIEPNFSRNVNGVKKLSFKMYKHFIDTVTGEKVDNPYSDWLISERKVKLYYEDKWYDFIVKNIVEDSKNYLYTYQLEDALVQELSKNGFGVTLDMKSNNNMGTANELAAEVLKETDWDVANDPEVFVERVDEALVYVTINTGNYSGRIKHIIDQDKNDRTTGITVKDADLTGTITALAFYSSCTGKPHRFQFIYLKKLDGTDIIPQLSVYKDDNRTIAEKDCQYYIDFDSEADYIEADNNFYLPNGITTIAKTEDKDYSPTILSCKYRGERYGFAHQAEYIPVLDRYCNIYKTEDGSLYYGYLNANYKSPALTTNLISGSALDSTHGWTGTRYLSDPNATAEEVEAAKKTEKATIESVFGYFNGNQFVDSIDEIKNGTFDPLDETKIYESYLRIYFPEGANKDRAINTCVINSCIYDNRTLIGNILKSDKWALKYDVFNKDKHELTFKLKECKYDPINDYYNETSGAGLVFGEFEFDEESGHYIATMGDNFTECSEKDFKKNTQTRLVITASAPGDYYIKSISLFKASYANGELITLKEQGENIEDRTVEKTYYYFSPAALDNITEASELKPDYTSKTLDYSTYKPVYNAGAEKVRSITAKESNYFNILQSIAETFEAWLLLEVERDELGGITNKYVKFKNYIGKDNYAGFRYGVNLQGIQRTYESKNIVTKLMVRPNSNEYAPNGFCTIQRANANPTGESYIYDFQYYFKRGLMNARDYLETIYIWNDDAKGPDIEGTTEINLQGYYSRIKALNEQIEDKNEILINTAKDIVQYKAELEVATAGVDAASSGLEQVREDFKALTKVDFPIKEAPLDEELGERLDVQKLLQEYATYYSEYTNHSTKKKEAKDNLDTVQKVYDTIESEAKALKEHKIALNQLFFKQYSRFIQEGTWIDEEYVDDDLYYADALSVLYNSCHPQVAYQINVLELSKLPGYELFKFELGDKTYAEDPEFFGEDMREEVIITELNENLDDPSKNTIKVQNFKNQFQDLFQKITATVQQAQYRTGSYERAVALAEANNERKNQFLSDALDTASARLTTAGQQSVTWGADGITVQDVDSPSDMIRMVGGAILLSKQDKNGEQKWVTGVTSDGISASLVTAGVINAGEIEIMNYDQPLFRWDSHGISAFDAKTETVDDLPVVTGVNSKKFVRFDKNGIYGISDKADIDGLGNWYPSDGDEIDKKATFALTWEGLKVTNENNISLRIGDMAKGSLGTNLLDVRQGNEEKPIFAIKGDGSLVWGAGSSPTKILFKAELKSQTDRPTDGTVWEDQPDSGPEWHKYKQSTDWYASYTYDGGGTWTEAVQIQSANTAEIIEWYYATSDSGKRPALDETVIVDGVEESIWKPSPTAADHSAVNKYLWNYEETKLTNGTSKYTVPALIATQPKEISKIYEFYQITATGIAPEKPSITKDNLTSLSGNDLKGWTRVNTSNGEDFSTATAQSQYLWNFSVIVFTDNSIFIGSIANIGTGGKGISSVQNWYQRTNTESPKPTKPASLTDTNWSDSVPAYNSEEGNCYLWTCESTVYSDSNTPIFTDVTLLSREPRNIDTITEYYYVGTGTPSNITLKNSNNEIDSRATGTGVDWNETYDTPEHGESLWNCEVIKYSTKDEKGSNLYKVVPAARIGYIGVDVYTLSLDNDVDVIVYNNAGTRISDLPVVKASRYCGNTTSNKGSVGLTKPSDDWGTDHYTWDGATLKIDDIPSGFTDGEFTFTWGEGSNVYDVAKFSLKKIISTVDYDLVIPQTTINSSQSDGEFAITVLKKSENGTETLLKSDGKVEIYKNDSLTPLTENEWKKQEYAQCQKDSIKYTLKSWDGSIIWDEEVVEFTQDGAGLKTINTTTPKAEYSYWALIANIGQEYSVNFGDNGNDTNILVGDTVYIPGIVTDRYADNNNKINQTITIYGLVTSVTAKKFTATITSVIWGGTKGDKGDGGSSPYTISLDQDFASIPVEHGTTVDPNNTSFNIYPTVYYGDEQYNDWKWLKEGDKDFGIRVVTNQLTSTPGADQKGKYCKIEKLTSTRGTATFELYNKDGQLLATTMFEAVLQEAGEPGTYVYMLAEPNILQENNLSNVTLTTYKRVGIGEPTLQEGYYYSYKIDEGDTQSLAGNNNIIIASTNLTNLKNKLQVYCYADEDRKILVDKETIEVVKEIKRDWYLYSASAERPALPTDKDWSSYSSETDDWSQTQSDNSKWYTCKGGAYTMEEQKDKAWCGPYRLDAQTMTYDDWYAVLEEKRTDSPNTNGIYQLGDGKVGISADVLDSGAIKVGGTPEREYKDAKFYAAMDNSAVYLAGWTVTNDQLVYIPSEKELGEAGTFGIYPSGNSTIPSTQFGGNLVTNDAWIMTAGTSFGITKFGKLFACAGEIAGLTINTEGLVKYALGQEESIHLRSTGIPKANVFGASSPQDWLVGVGENFGVTKTGAVYAKELHASNSGDIAGWLITSTGLIKGDLGAHNGIHLYTTPEERGEIFGEEESQKWLVGIGSQLGITSNGSLHCNSLIANGGRFSLLNAAQSNSVYVAKKITGSLEYKNISLTCYYQTRSATQSVVFDWSAGNYVTTHTASTTAWPKQFSIWNYEKTRQNWVALPFGKNDHTNDKGGPAWVNFYGVYLSEDKAYKVTFQQGYEFGQDEAFYILQKKNDEWSTIYSNYNWDELINKVFYLAAGTYFVGISCSSSSYTGNVKNYIEFSMEEITLKFTEGGLSGRIDKSNVQNSIPTYILGIDSNGNLSYTDFFKKLCDIKFRNSVVGEIFQCGPIIYGYMRNDIQATDTSGGFSLTGTVPGPCEDLVMNYAYLNHDGAKASAEVRLKKTSNTDDSLTISAEGTTSTDTPYPHYTYFCYSPSSDYHVHQ